MTWLEIVLTVCSVAVAGATPFIVLYARRAAQSVAKVAGVTLTDEQLKQLDTWVTYAISFVEEQARKRAKGLPSVAPIQTAEEKRTMAIQVARELAPDDLKGFSDKALEIVIDAKVGDRRVSIVPPALSKGSLPPLPTARA